MKNFAMCAFYPAFVLKEDFCQVLRSQIQLQKLQNMYVQYSWNVTTWYQESVVYKSNVWQIYTAQCMKGYVYIWPLQRSRYGWNKLHNIFVKFACYWKHDGKIASEMDPMAQIIAAKGVWIYGQCLGGVASSLTMSVRWQKRLKGQK